MGSTLSFFRYQINKLQDRLSLNEKDTMNLYLNVKKNTEDIHSAKQKIKEIDNHILNISLLEEGRSSYRHRSRVSHTASSFN